MLTRILLLAMLRSAAVIVGVGVALAFLLGGPDVAIGVALGGALVGGSGAVQIWLVGQLFDPDQGTPQKVVMGTLLVLKLVAVGGALWWVLARMQPHEVGLLVGMGLGLASLVVGVNQGSMTKEAQAAMDDASRRIAEKMEDSEDERR